MTVVFYRGIELDRRMNSLSFKGFDSAIYYRMEMTQHASSVPAGSSGHFRAWTTYVAGDSPPI
jgi:pullulanase/glycogen debranching enzyme